MEITIVRVFSCRVTYIYPSKKSIYYTRIGSHDQDEDDDDYNDDEDGSHDEDRDGDDGE